MRFYVITRTAKYANSAPAPIQQVFASDRKYSKVFARSVRGTAAERRVATMETRPACISIADVQHAVARIFCLSVGEMLSRKRRHHLAGARQVAMYLSRELAGGGWTGPRRRAASFPRIGMAFARDHTSVIHACNAVARRRAADPEFARLLDRIARELVAAPRHQHPACNTAVSVWNGAVSIRTARVQPGRVAPAAEALTEKLNHFALREAGPAGGAQRQREANRGR
jgi:hypothetical protein